MFVRFSYKPIWLSSNLTPNNPFQCRLTSRVYPPINPRIKNHQNQSTPLQILTNKPIQHNMHSDSATEEATVSKTPRRKGNKGPEKMTEYEKQRMKRIEQNKARMIAMGLDKMASLVMGSVPISKKDNKKGKKKVGLEDDDEEYKPSDIDEESGSSSGSDGEDEDKVCVSKTKNTKENFQKKILNERIARLSGGIAFIKTQVELKDKQLRMEDAVNATKAAIEEGVVVGGDCCLLRLSLKINEIKKLMDNEEQKTKRKNSTPSKNISKRSGIAHTVDDDDDDEALMKAFALSLQHSSGFLDVENKTPPQRSDAKASNVENFERKQSVRKDDSGKRKRKNLFTSRVQMTEDELILHFFQFDEAGKGGINLRDLQRVAASHDFTWKDEEMEHMIHFFDSDGDGKLSLEDFTKIVERCNMRQGSENAERASIAS